jgi:hypothetical protein
MVFKNIVALPCVRDCSENHFLPPLGKKDCNEKPDRLAAHLKKA